MNQLLFFAELQDRVGKERIDIDLEGKTVQQVKEYVEDTYELHKAKEAMIAINEEFASRDTLIKKGDVVAFIPPVSGG
ncbi:molybdopterin converting factor subunit 1 [Halobacillus salinus]|uniref:Molybdopterin synthase sulfur carrier subunit n=1 Tax=Halobacillus salinus TaxID=192814 RepID=A0A4Z0H8M0_9BACI|nr:molybdopterin converting factor subunit 1 [Halobacillus salinus]TGB05236.1 molybdopterin converting factor subunit 1 [Halobacillus salinus]